MISFKSDIYLYLFTMFIIYKEAAPWTNGISHSQALYIAMRHS